MPHSGSLAAPRISGDVEEVLRENPLFAHLPATAIHRLAVLAQWLEFPEGTIRLEQSAEDDWVYVVAVGRLRVVRVAPDGRVLALWLLLAHDLLWWRAGADAVLAEHLEALRGAVVLLRLPWPTTLAALAAVPESAALLIEALRHRLLFADNRLAAVVLLDVRARVAHALALLIEGQPGGEIAMTQAELAAFVGTSREEVAKQLGALRSLGVVENTRRHGQIRVRDPRRLVELCSGEPNVCWHTDTREDTSV
jgi:CRP-like cAMP-binding protein